MTSVVVVIGSGQIGLAIARRVGAGKHILLADLRKENADAAAEVLADVGFEVSVATVDVSSRESVEALVQTASALGEVTGLIHAAGASPRRPRPQRSCTSTPRHCPRAGGVRHGHRPGRHRRRDRLDVRTPAATS
jgi:NAD(P)-dependent dehydrogenase (short-subunit alcohol dehydrogenase family)